MAPYSYPTPNSQLVEELKLIKHPEGGYFVETDRQPHDVPTPFVAGNPSRSLATAIYYLLTHDDANGYFHMNKSFTYHVLHQGRAEYTLIHPTSPPRIEKAVMGTDASKGEVRQLLVGTGVWKMSRIPPEDVQAAQTAEDRDRTGCLITEVVVPGFHWEDHKFLTQRGLEELFSGAPGAAERISELKGFVKEA
ncbi:hypothetical protein PUNSTDRAFT_94005 [Punctularia strigosozonata HHB-11173 SS5]|uniref:DUF985 domain-containing protein n=1 Tax=Punctularia strigosozonata (strain HHB-11173) TaxID=741275 RepID=R7S0T1_PUNST|nr:uncharacterized protein PUNSTDRAFT_94005 [Punctularia strigosozonata HHB-11173 SS5]EIN03459.1 hypothetical protein PUNSTDRAFT_94005 [Punctularia strigosozonata HHB-11173 SS5]